MKKHKFKITSVWNKENGKEAKSTYTSEISLPLTVTKHAEIIDRILDEFLDSAKSKAKRKHGENIHLTTDPTVILLDN